MRLFFSSFFISMFLCGDTVVFHAAPATVLYRKYATLYSVLKSVSRRLWNCYQRRGPKEACLILIPAGPPVEECIKRAWEFSSVFSVPIRSIENHRYIFNTNTGQTVDAVMLYLVTYRSYTCKRILNPFCYGNQFSWNWPVNGDGYKKKRLINFSLKHPFI